MQRWGLTLTNPNPNPNRNTNPNPTGVSCVRTTRPLWARSTPSRSPPRGGTRRASQTRGYPNPNPNLNPNPNPNSNPNLSPNPNPNPNPNPSSGTRRSWQTAASTSARGRRSRKPSRRMLTRAPAESAPPLLERHLERACFPPGQPARPPSGPWSYRSVKRLLGAALDSTPPRTTGNLV